MLVLKVLYGDDYTIEDPFYCAPAWSCSSASSSSVLALSWLRITHSMILLEWLIRLMVQWF